MPSIILGTRDTVVLHEACILLVEEDGRYMT